MQPTGPTLPFDQPPGGAGRSQANPYSAPQAHGALNEFTPQRTGGLTAICVVAIVLGAFGALGALMGTVGMLLNERFQSMAQGLQGAGLPPEAQQVQQQMNQQMLALTRRWKPILLPLHAANLVLSVLLLVGAIGLLRRSAGGAKVFSRALLGCLLYVLFNAPASAMYSLQTSKIVQQFMPAMMQAASPPQGAPEAATENVVQTTMVVAMAISIGWIVVWHLAQAVFYAISFFSVKKRLAGPGDGAPAAFA